VTFLYNTQSRSHHSVANSVTLECQLIRVWSCLRLEGNLVSKLILLNYIFALRKKLPVSTFLVNFCPSLLRSDDCQQVYGEDYHNCSLLYCVSHLCTVMSMLTKTDSTNEDLLFC